MTKLFETDLQIILTLMDLTESDTYVYDPKGQVNRQDSSIFQHYFTEEDLLSLEIAQLSGRKITLMTFGSKPLKKLLRLAQVSRIIHFSKTGSFTRRRLLNITCFSTIRMGRFDGFIRAIRLFPSFLNLYNGSG